MNRGPVVARRGQWLPGGFTLLEAVVSITILAVVMQTSISATLVMSKSGQFGMTSIEQEARARMSLKLVAAELRSSSTGSDSLNEPYITVAGEPGKQTLTYRRVAQFGSYGVEVVPMWTTPIEVRIEKGQLIRRQDEIDTVIANFAETFDVSIDQNGRVDVQLGSARPSHGVGGEILHTVHHVRVSPMR